MQRRQVKFAAETAIILQYYKKTLKTRRLKYAKTNYGLYIFFSP